MRLFRGTLVLIAIFYTCVKAMDVCTFTKDWSIFSNYYEFEFIDNVARHDNKFAYGVCKKSNFYTELECDIRLETLSESAPRGDIKTCHYKLNVSEEQKTRIYRLDLFGDDKILITELNRIEDANEGIIYLRYSILDMDKCTQNDIMYSQGIDLNNYRSTVIMYNETFDIITTDKASCGSSSACRLNFDQWGKRISEPVSFPSDLLNLDVIPVQPLSSTQGFYVVGRWHHNNRFLVRRLGPDGTVTHLMTLEYSSHDILHKDSFNNDNSFSTCSYEVFNKTEIRCVQFAERDGDARINVTLPFDKDTTVAAVYNLPDGFMVITIMGNKDYKCHNFEVTKVSTNGRKSSFVIDELDLHCFNELGVKLKVKDDKNDICFNFVAEEPVFEGHKFIKRSMQYRSKCVSKRDIETL